MAGRRLPLPIGSALAAALTAALVFSAGALWLRHALYAAQMADAVNQAHSDLYTNASPVPAAGIGIPASVGPSSIAVFVDLQGQPRQPQRSRHVARCIRSARLQRQQA
jgi:hypothetical protein